MNKGQIVLKNVRVHNLKGVNLTLNHHEFIVFTGVSGSGKSSLAFDTLFVEGQRRYLESFPHSLRHILLDVFEKPNVEKIEGLTPTIAVEQKSLNRSHRSTVGTLTEIYDYLRVLFAKLAIPHCPICKQTVQGQSKEKILEALEKIPLRKTLFVLAPFIKNKKTNFKDELEWLKKLGYLRVRIDGKIFLLEEPLELDPQKFHRLDIVFDRLITSKEELYRLKESASHALDVGKGSLILFDPISHEELFFSTSGYCVKCNISYPPLSASNFSFNHPNGMCSRCDGVGVVSEFILDRVIDPKKSIAEDCCSIAPSYKTIRYKNIYDNLAEIFHFSTVMPFEKLSKDAQNIFLYGSKKEWLPMTFTHPEKKVSWVEYVHFRGVLHEAHERLKAAKSSFYHMKKAEFLQTTICPQCLGAKLDSYPAEAKLHDKKIFEITEMTIEKCLEFFKKFSFKDAIEKTLGQDLRDEMIKRLEYLKNVGLGYLTLDRTSESLSGGEAQRVKLAGHIGCGLVGTTYILDEPSIGLHPEDHEKLLSTLEHLKNVGNTVIVIEHDIDTMLYADTIVDVGPFAGHEGGEIIAKGSVDDICKNPRSITGDFLSKRKEISIPEKRRVTKTTPHLEIFGAYHNNLKHIDVKIPLERFIAITGVSGSGKSSLITDTLFPALEHIKNNPETFDPKKFAIKKLQGAEKIKKIILIDQSPIGRTPRSNPATYIQLFDDIRQLFSALPISQARGFTSSHFSFNASEGACPYCKGLGSVKMEIENFQEADVQCPECEGKRFSEEILSIRYKDKNIFDVLSMEFKEAKEFFANIPAIFSKCSLLDEVGLGYLQLGQSAPTLSGGEAQRIKLAKELAKKFSSGSTLYLFDEPTTGLHLFDMEKLLYILQRLVDKKNSVIVIEHNMELVKTADWVIELGPLGGEGGGEVCAYASAENLAKKDTPTGRALAKTFQKILPHPKKRKIAHKKIDKLVIHKASQNNLKAIDLTLPYGKWIGFCGLSGSGRTSLAFDTIFEEGKRRYLETLSPYLRQFFGQNPRPKVEKIENLIPTIALEQKNHVVSPRSTVGTLTETFDGLRVLFAHLGRAFCPETLEPIESITKEFILKQIKNFSQNTKIQILAPVQPFPAETFEKFVDRFQREGFLRLRLNGVYYDLDEPNIPYDDSKKNNFAIVIDRLIVKDPMETDRLLEAISLAARLAKDTLIIDKEGEDLFFNLRFAVKSTGKSYPPLTPQSFSFNSEKGMCPDCQGLGFIFGAEFQKDENFLTLTLQKLAMLLFKNNPESQTMFLTYFRSFDFPVNEPLKNLSQKEKELLFFGDFSKEFFLKKKKYAIAFAGLNPILAKAAKHASFPFKEALKFSMQEKKCPSCNGCRLNPLARHVELEGKTITELLENYSLQMLFDFLENLSLKEKSFLKETLSEMKKRLSFLIKIGLDYLTLHRGTSTLSGGEIQRLFLARHLGTYLSSCLYLINEPTMGLHPYNIEKLIKSFKELLKENNSLIIVEHDPVLLKEADLLVEFGPSSGDMGGRIIAKGTPKEFFEKNPNSQIAPYLEKRKKVDLLKKRSTSDKEKIFLKNVSMHNLKNFDVSIPLGVITAVTGVSGSGKSTLIQDILFQKISTYIHTQTLPQNIAGAVDKIHQAILFEHIPIRATHRADVATFSELLTLFREIFSSLPASKAKGLLPRYFSYYHKKGMCQTCQGLGYQIVNLLYLPSTEIICPSCKGFRLNPLALTIEYLGKHLGEVLEMTVDQLLEFFHVFPKILKKAKLLSDLGLGYLKLKQELATLSFGEMQRLSLFKELIKRPKGHTLYLFDEPSLGLHPIELAKIIPYFHDLIKKGHTVLMIEHNLDLIAEADYVIDLGPGAGEKGGHLLFSGPFDQFLLEKTSQTAKYLHRHLES